jgi:hypothetical protein
VLETTLPDTTTNPRRGGGRASVDDGEGGLGEGKVGEIGGGLDGWRGCTGVCVGMCGREGRFEKTLTHYSKLVLFVIITLPQRRV